MKKPNVPDGATTEVGSSSATEDAVNAPEVMATATTPSMSRLSSFIRANVDTVVAEWEIFARSLDLSNHMSAEELRDHCKEMLLVVADDMNVSESDQERTEKSKGHSDASTSAESPAISHGALRHMSGFDLVQLVSEFRALRASVLSLYEKSMGSGGDSLSLEDNIRFNEAIDGALAESVKSYDAQVASSRDMFLAILGHDLRGPLSTISMSARALGKGDVGEELRFRTATRVERAVLQMGHLITDLLEFTQCRLGDGIPIKRTNCDLGQLCAEVMELVRASHPDQAFSFQATGKLQAMADRERMEQVLSNLLYNAVQHGEHGAPVLLILQGEAEDVVVQVCNSGRPIPPDILPSVFEPLVRAPPSEMSASTDRSQTSLGLGLFIVREIVRGHGGSIQVTSDLRAGTVFTVRLPRSETPSGVMPAS